jgi:hypothetical protein
MKNLRRGETLTSAGPYPERRFPRPARPSGRRHDQVRGLALALVLAALGSGAGQAATVTLQPGEDASKDVFVYAFSAPGTLGIPTPPNNTFVAASRGTGFCAVVDRPIGGFSFPKLAREEA